MNGNSTTIQNRWGRTLQDGFVVVPVALIARQAELDLDSGEMVLLLNLLAQWHDNEEPVWAAISRFAKHMNASDRTVQRMLSSLKKKKLIRVEKRPEGKVVHLDVLAERLQEKA